MAGFANRKKKPQQGIYPGSGVAQGGQQGRKKALHGGLTSAKKGGANPLGSQRRPINTQKRNVRPQAGWKPSAPIISPGYAAGGSIAPNIGAAIKPSAPAYNAPAYAPPKLGDQSTHDSQYALSMNKALYDWNQGTADLPALNAQLKAAPGLYDKSKIDLDYLTKKRREQEQADFVARGGFQSGGRILADVERGKEYGKSLDALNYDYGTEGMNRLRAQILAKETQYGVKKDDGTIVGGQYDLDRQQAELDALNRYNENNPAPLAEIPAPAGGGGGGGGAAAGGGGAAGGAAAGIDGKRYKSGYYWDKDTLMFLNENGARAKVTNPWKIKVARAGNLDGMVDAPWKQKPVAAPAPPTPTPGFTPGVAPGIGGVTLPKPPPAATPAPRKYKSGYYVDNGKLMFLNEDGGRAPVTSPWKLKVWRAGNLGGMVKAPWNQ